MSLPTTMPTWYPHISQPRLELIHLTHMPNILW